jgi:hypothetical protein
MVVAPVGSLAGRIDMAKRTLSLAAVLLVCGVHFAFPKGGSFVKDDPWDPHHISDLPNEVRQYIAGICKGAPRAQHDFATYSPQQKRWRINLEYLDCKGLGEFRRGNQCLDVDFVEVGSGFRIASKTYRDCGF